MTGLPDRLPPGDAVHELSHPLGWQAALAHVRRERWWSQYAGHALGRRRGRLVEVHRIQSWNADQDTGDKGYLEDDEIIWRIDLICTPHSGGFDRPLDMVGTTVVLQGHVALPLDGNAGMVWGCRVLQDGALSISGTRTPIHRPRVPDVELRLMMTPRGEEAAGEIGWGRVAPLAQEPTGARWGRAFSLWRVECDVRGLDADDEAEARRLLNGAWEIPIDGESPVP